MVSGVKNYLALDQSLNITGFACFNAEGQLIENGTFNIPKNKPIDERLAAFYKQLTELVKDKNIVHIFFEDIQYQNNKDTFKKLAFVQATILLWCYWNEIKYTILSPSHWRKIITDNYGIKFGRARAEQKKNCFNFVTEKWNLLSTDVTEDETDAIALGMAGLIELNESKSAW